MSRAQNRGLLAIGDLSPGQNFYRHAMVQNRGFGDISPEMLTLHSTEENQQIFRVIENNENKYRQILTKRAN